MKILCVCELIIDQLVGSLWWNLPTQVFSTWRGCSHFFWIYSRIYRLYVFSGRRRPHRQRDACGDFINLMIGRLGPLDVLIGVGFAYIYS
jgi:hypothetical protein